MSRTNRAIISVCFAIVALSPFFRPDQMSSDAANVATAARIDLNHRTDKEPSDAADVASAVRVDPYHGRKCQGSEREIVVGDYILCRSFEMVARISAEVSYICDRLNSDLFFRDRDGDGVGNCEVLDGRLRKVSKTECARWNGWWNQNVTPGLSYVLGPHCEFSQAIMDALDEFPEADGLAESPAVYKERMDSLAYSRELNKANFARRDAPSDTCAGGDECGYMDYSYEPRYGPGPEDSGWSWDAPSDEPCVGDCYDMDNDGRTWNDIDRDGDGRYESD